MKSDGFVTIAKSNASVSTVKRMSSSIGCKVAEPNLFFVKQNACDAASDKGNEST